jgi:cadmium resistance protein CadD (predicted permease)
MNRNVKIAIGFAVGVGLIYLGYKYLFKGSESEGTDTSKENIVHDKSSREVVLVENA